MGKLTPPHNLKRVQITLSRIFNYCFFIAILLILLCSIFFISENPHLQFLNKLFSLSLITGITLIGIGLIYTTFHFFSRKSISWNKKISIINAILITILAFATAITVQMNYQLADGESCIKIAQQLAPTMNWTNVPYGNQHTGYCYALIRCANMAPLIYIQALTFKFLSLIGIKLSFSGMVAFGTYLNTIMLLISLYLAYKIIKKYCQPFIVTGFTFLALINIPLYATVYYVYTDIPSLLMVMIILTSYDSFLSTPNSKKKVIFLILIILASILGSLLKFNVIIATIAIIIHYILSNNWKKTLKFVLLLLIPITIGITGSKSLIFSTSPIPKEEIGLPAMNWVNMSFANKETNGGFYGKYFKHTYELKKKYKSKKKVQQIEIKEFINGLIHKPTYYLEIIYRKIGATYGIGTYDFYSFFSQKYIAHPKLEKTFLGQLFYGKLRKFYLYGTFILQLSLFAFMGWGTLKMIRQKVNITFLTPWMIALFGDMFMLLFWETHSRYLLAFVGAIYIITCVGLNHVFDTAKK